MNKTLILMRHAKSDWSTGISNDFDRPLNQRGRDDAEKMGKFMALQNIQLDRLVCSPAIRASETAEYIQKSLKLDDTSLEYEPKLYMGVPGETLRILTRHLHSCNTLMMVSHNPLLDQLLSIFWRDTELPYTGSGKLVTTANLLVFELSGQLDNCISDLAVVKKAIYRPKTVSL